MRRVVTNRTAKFPRLFFLRIGFKPDPTETAALILPGYIGYVAANILRIGFKPDPLLRSSFFSVLLRALRVSVVIISPVPAG